MSNTPWTFKITDTFANTANEKAKRANLNKAKFTKEFYNKINEVIGGDNPNQFLTLLFPGIA